jgi:NADH-quinone oxidoreductase subunit B
MRIQDKIRGHRIAKKHIEGEKSFLSLGEKVEDELPVPHHSGWVNPPADQEPLFDHQKITG